MTRVNASDDLVPRGTSNEGRLARLGFTDVDRASRLLRSPALQSVSEHAAGSLGQAADPDLALLLLARIAESATDPLLEGPVTALLNAFVVDPRFRDRLIAVLGVSEALGDHIARHPDQWTTLAGFAQWPSDPAAVRRDLLTAVGANPLDDQPVARGADESVLVDLRVAYRNQLLVITAADVMGEIGFETVSLALADLADAALDAGLAIARAGLPEGSPAVRLAVIGMGKCGGRELNYISDVDVIFVAEPMSGGDESEALRTATLLATGLMRACSHPTIEGSLWEVDPGLRPEGRQGALVRTLASHLGYYERWAKTWEFQALLKARHSAGDRALGQAYTDAITPLVWSAANRDDFVNDVQQMRRRVESTLPARDLDRQLKLGPGGLRDVEFSVQLLQLVHGRSDFMLHSSTTLVALEALATWGYVGRDDASTLSNAYRFLRTLEHRIQLYRLRRSHVIPDGEADLRRIGRSLGYRAEPVKELQDAIRRHRREVRRLHEKLFYRPLLNAVARLEPGSARLTPTAAKERLEALGYVDPEGALRHLEALTSGVSRRAAIQRTLLPVMLGWFADSPDPDAALLGFRRVSDVLGSSPWYLGLLRDESVVAERLSYILGASRYATELLLGAPEAVSMLADDAELRPRTREQLDAECIAAAQRHDDPTLAVGAVRSLRRRELFRIAAADLLSMLSVAEVSEALSDVSSATLDGGLAGAIMATEQVHGHICTRFAVIAMGRLGGAELGYGSDADVMFVHDPDEGVDEKCAADCAQMIAEELRILLQVPSTDPPLGIDTDLRPEGRQGALVRSIASYAAYYDRWSAPWESQALLRARPVAGDRHLCERFVELINPMRYPEGGISDAEVREIRRIKARIESERLPRGSDASLHTKLGRGGLVDVEWVAQLLQLQHAFDNEDLRTTSTLRALEAARATELLTSESFVELTASWTIATRVRNAIMLVRGSASDQLTTAPMDLGKIARIMGYPVGSTGQLLDEYRRITRRARTVVERVFYGE